MYMCTCAVVKPARLNIKNVSTEHFCSTTRVNTGKKRDCRRVITITTCGFVDDFHMN